MTLPLTTPLRLSAALAHAFPQGGMTLHGLRLEARRGRLKIARVAGKDFTTLAAIEEMLRLCELPKAPKDTGEQPRSSVAKDAFMRVLQDRRAAERSRKQSNLRPAT